MRGSRGGSRPLGVFDELKIDRGGVRLELVKPYARFCPWCGTKIKRGKGRPAKPDALSPSERQRAYRARKKGLKNAEEK